MAQTASCVSDPGESEVFLGWIEKRRARIAPAFEVVGALQEAGRKARAEFSKSGLGKRRKAVPGWVAALEVKLAVVLQSKIFEVVDDES